MSIGEALADARRQAGLTVSRLSDRARVRETIITDIEGDDYSACGGDSYARGYIRIIAQAVGADPEPLIREYNTARPVPQPITDDITEPITRVRMRKRLRLNWVAVPVLVWLGLAVYDLHGGLPHVASAASPARAHTVTQRHAGHVRKVPPMPKAATSGAVPARTLTPVSAAAFGPSGIGQGDEPELAPLRSTAILLRHGIPTSTPPPASGTCIRARACSWTWAGRRQSQPPGSRSARLTAPASSCAPAPHPHWPTCHPSRKRPAQAVWYTCGSPHQRTAVTCSSGSPACRPTRQAPSRPACMTSAWKVRPDHCQSQDSRPRISRSGHAAGVTYRAAAAG